MKIFRTDPDRFGIRARLLTLLLPGVLGLLALDSWNDYRALSHLVQDTYDRAMLESVNSLRSGLSVAPDGSLKWTAPSVSSPGIFDAASPQRQRLHVGLRQVNGPAAEAPPSQTLFGENDLPAPPERTVPGAAIGEPRTVWYDSRHQDQPVRVVAYQAQLTDGRGQLFELLIQSAESTGPRDQAQAASLRQELTRDARMVLVMVLLVWLGVTWSLWPLERLRRSVLQSQGDALQALDTSGVPHEVAPLVDAINQQVASHRALLAQQSRFLADASHQLRTPLAIMLTQAGVALREKDPGRVQETLRAIVSQIARSRRLCEQLLSLAHASDRAPPADAPERVDLNAIARDVVLQYLTLAHDKNQDLGWTDARGEPAGHGARDGELPADRQAVPVLASGPELHEVLSNLVHNAIVYTPAGGRITVMAGADGEGAWAEVRDDGPGIAPARRAEVFERFHHNGHASGTGSRGAGLGLAIARAYARRNGGDVTLADLPAHEAGVLPGATGLRAILSLPLAG